MGALQKLQDSLAKWAAMAANLCGARWGHMGHLLSMLSAEAAAGACHELRPLLKVTRRQRTTAASFPGRLPPASQNTHPLASEPVPPGTGGFVILFQECGSVRSLRDLVSSVQIASITAAQARLLFAAGLTTPGLVAAAGEDAVAKALAAGVRRRALDEAHAVLKVGKTGASGTNALVARDAQGILAGEGARPSPACILHSQQDGVVD